jgi:hypothetical protein
MKVNIRAASSHPSLTSTVHLIESLEPRWLASASHYHTGTAVSYRHRQPAVVQPLRTVRYGHHYRALPAAAVAAPQPAAAPPPAAPPVSGVPNGGYTGTTSGVLGDEVPDYIYDSSNGELRFTSDGLSGVGIIHIYSQSGKFLKSASGGFVTSRPGEYSEFIPTGIVTRDLGQLLPAHLTKAELLQDLTLRYNRAGVYVAFAADLIVTEPPPVIPPPPVNPPPTGPGITPPHGATGTTLGILGDGTPDYIYEASTGNLRFTSDGLPHVVGLLEAYSASGKFLMGTPDAFLLSAPDGIEETDLGAMLPANLTSDELLADLTLRYGWKGQPMSTLGSAADLIIV